MHYHFGIIAKKQSQTENLENSQKSPSLEKNYARHSGFVFLKCWNKI